MLLCGVTFLSKLPKGGLGLLFRKKRSPYSIGVAA
jgi:hypothetical protein